MNSNLNSQLLVLLGVLVLTGGLYGLGLNGPFLLDDFTNLSAIATDGGVTSLDDLLRYMFSVSGTDFSRSLARLSFVVSDQYWPSLPYDFKLTNIAIHLINGLLIALLMLRLLPLWLDKLTAERVALLCATLWLLHPLHVSTTLYVVQRMTQLMLLFLLLSLLFYILFRNARTYSGAAVALLCSALTAICSVLSKENGAVVLALFPLLEFYGLQQQPSRFQTLSRRLACCLGLIFVVVLGAAAVYKFSGYDSRFYSLWERLQIQGWVLFEYIRYIVVPGSEGMSIFHDDVEWNMYWHGLEGKGWFWLFHLGIGLISWRFFRSHRIIILGLLWFYLCHLIESTIIPLELMFEHRNYLASIGLLLIVAYCVDIAASRLKSKMLPVAALVLIITPVIYLSIQLAHRSALWSDYRILVHKWAVEHPDSLRAQYAQIFLMAQDGFVIKALEQSLAQEQVFGDLTLPLYRIQLQCEMDPSVSSENKLDIKRFANVNYTSGVAPALKNIIKSEQRDCIERQLQGGGLDDLVVAVGNMPLLKNKKKNYAQYLDIADGYYFNQRDYSRTAETRERLWEVQPTIVTALKLIELFILGGDYENARKYLDWAVAEKDSLWFHDTVAERNIAHLSKLLADLQRQESSVE
jgi:hypothetical protein